MPAGCRRATMWCASSELSMGYHIAYSGCTPSIQRAVHGISHSLFRMHAKHPAQLGVCKGWQSQRLTSYASSKLVMGDQSFYEQSSAVQAEQMSTAAGCGSAIDVIRIQRAAHMEVEFPVVISGVHLYPAGRPSRLAVAATVWCAFNELPQKD